MKKTLLFLFVLILFSSCTKTVTEFEEMTSIKKLILKQDNKFNYYYEFEDVYGLHKKITSLGETKFLFISGDTSYCVYKVIRIESNTLSGNLSIDETRKIIELHISDSVQPLHLYQSELKEIKHE